MTISKNQRQLNLFVNKTSNVWREELISEPLLRKGFFNVVLSQNSIFFKYIFNQLFPRNRFNCFQGEEEGAKENRFYSLCVWLDHDVAVDEDGADDRAGEEGVGEHVDGNPDDYHGYHDFDDAHLNYIRCNDDEDICIMI